MATEVGSIGRSPLFESTQTSNEKIGTDLLLAAHFGDKASVEALLKQPGINVDFAYSDGTTPLIAAAAAGHNDIVTVLLEKGASPDMMRDRSTPFREAVMGGHEDVVRTLATKFPRFVQTPFDSALPIGWAVFYHKQPGVVKCLLEFLPSNSINRPVNGKTLLCQAVRFGRINMVRFLVNHPEIDLNLAGEGPFPPDGKGDLPPIILAARQHCISGTVTTKYQDIANLLKEKGADIAGAIRIAEASDECVRMGAVDFLKTLL